MCLTLCPVSLIPLEANLALQDFCTSPFMLLRSSTDLPEGGRTTPVPVASITPCLAIFPLSFWEESSGGEPFLLESVAVLNCHLKATWAHREETGCLGGPFHTLNLPDSDWKQLLLQISPPPSSSL